MAERRKVTDKQAADTIAAYQRGEQLPAGTIIDYSGEAPFVFTTAPAKAETKASTVTAAKAATETGTAATGTATGGNK